MKNQTFS